MTAPANVCIVRRDGGHTLIELMVAIIIGLIMVLASFQVLATFEGHKRTTTAMNDALQSGSFGLYTLDKLVRSSGTGLVQSTSFAYGCLLNYTSSGGVAVSNGTVTLPVPFDTVLSTGGGKLRLAPAVIFPNIPPYPSATTSSDVFLLMSGGAGYGEVPISITGPPTSTLLTVESTVGLRATDWILVGVNGVPFPPCTVTPVVSTLSNVALTLNGAASMSSYSNGYVVGLGSAQAASFVMYGVGANNSLYNVDLLNSDLTTAQLVSDDIVLLRAVYGVDPGATGSLTWTRPSAGVVIAGITYDYSPAGLLSGATAATTALRSIKAIRAAVVVRAPLSERADASDTTIGTGHAVNAGTYTLFSALPAAVRATWTVPAGQEGYRYRVLEGTIPLRNASP
jgi:type IV pilus assembly protein PilW